MQGNPENQVERSQLESVLRQVRHPETGENLLDSGTVRSIRIEGGRVFYELHTSTPGKPVVRDLVSAIGKALRAVPGVTEVDFEVVPEKAEGHAAHGGEIPPPQEIPGVASVIAIASGKGGVGKSTVAVNLAVAMAQEGIKVGICDADMYGPSIPQLLGISERPTVEDQKLVPVVAHGVKVASLGFMLPQHKPAVWRGPLVAGAVQQLLRQVKWGELDCLLVDLPPGTGDAQLTLAQSVPLTGVIVVTMPQHLAADIAVKAVSMFRLMEVPILGLIENMSTYQCPECGHTSDIWGTGGRQKACQALGVECLAALPLDPKVCEDGDAGLPIVVSEPESVVAKEYKRVAARLAVGWKIPTRSASAVD